MSQQPAKHEFRAEISQLLDLVANSLYGDAQIFVRELISNSSDALEKARQQNILNGNTSQEDPFQIKISFDKEQGEITFADNGCGMSQTELVEFLGTVANSGTSNLIKQLSSSDAKHDLIGQFGVGFYSTFIVAKSVEVTSLKQGDDPKNATLWRATTGENSYETMSAEMSSAGTVVRLILKDEHKEYADQWKLQQIITKYSDYISFPIMLEKPVADTSSDDAQENDDAKAEDASTDTQAETTTETEWEQVNHASAIWTRPRKDITTEDYQSFYRHISHDSEAAAKWTHFKIEGKQEFSGILYLPSKAPWDLAYRDKRTGGLKLFVQRVFILDEADQLIPIYLRFIKGVIDSNDLPLNVSREILQNSRATQNIKQTVTKRALTMLEDLAKNSTEDYTKFWNTFGNVLKEGVGEDFTNKDRLLHLMRFASTHTADKQQTVSLADYIGRMQESQKKIYYIIADSYESAVNSPHLEVFKKKGLEVLLLHDQIDEWLASHLSQFEEKEFQSVAKGDLQEDESEADKQALEEKTKAFDSVLKQAKGILSDRVKDVLLSKRLTDSPSCLTVAENEMSNHLKRMLEDAGQAVPDVKPTLELNPEHSFVERLQSETSDEAFEKWVNFLYGQAVISESGQLSDPVTYIKSVNRLLEGLVR